MYCKKLNQVFNWILLVIYCADFVALVGYLSRIASQYDDPARVPDLLRDCVGAITFASYGTVFGIYFVKVHENVPTVTVLCSIIIYKYIVIQNAVKKKTNS